MASREKEEKLDQMETSDYLDFLEKPEVYLAREVNREQLEPPVLEVVEVLAVHWVPKVPKENREILERKGKRE